MLGIDAVLGDNALKGAKVGGPESGASGTAGGVSVGGFTVAPWKGGNDWQKVAIVAGVVVSVTVLGWAFLRSK